MSSVQFEEEQYASRSILGAPVQPKMAGFLMKTGIVKTRKGARVLMMILVILCFAVSGYLYKNLLFPNTGGDQGNISPEALMQP